MEAVIIENPGVDQLIGNKAKCPDESVIDVPVYRVKSEVAVVTRDRIGERSRGSRHWWFLPRRLVLSVLKSLGRNNSDVTL